ncbi:hypothetical protein [uncultured Methylobacterium sp.]|uniref:hypothetical protein n=1 Tax=uncultured Methylobacterium sp. TaxID=157278 RepID=UPI0035C9F14D
MRWFCPAFMALLSTFDVATAQSLPNKPLVENFAALSVAAKWCDGYVVDILNPMAMIVEKRVNIAKPPYEQVFDEAKEKLEAAMGEIGVGQFCAITYKRFRPGGEVPGLMMKK